MKPISLKFKGIGSYFKETELDFTRLDSVFLICGETGAGKTTILDAMTAALYGESSGGERGDWKSLITKSYRKDDGEAYCEFEFELSGKRYLFTAGCKPKQRAAGYDYYRDCRYFDGSNWCSFFDNPKERAVNDKAGEILGLTAEQFRRVVILPQGKFEKLLTSDSKEKEEILTTLFGAERFEKIVDALQETANRESDRIKNEKKLIGERIKAEGFERTEDAGAKAAELAEEAEILKKALEEAQAQKDIAEKAKTDGAVLSSRFEQLDAAEKNVTALKGEKDKRERDRQRIDRLAAEKEVLADIDNYLAAKKELSAREKNLSDCISALGKADSALKNAEEQENAHRQGGEENKKAAEELIRLRELIPVYENAAPLKAELEAALKEGKRLRKESDELSQKLSDLKSKTEEEKKKSEELQKTADAAVELLEKYNTLKNGEKTAGELRKILACISDKEKHISELTEKLAAAEAEEKAAGAFYNEEKRKYEAGFCARLAVSLSENSPCPVCGSVHHPAKASPAPEYTGDTDQAEKRYTKALKIKTELETGLSGERGNLSGLRERAEALSEEVRNSGYSPEILEKAERERKNSEEAQKALAAVREEIKAFEADKENLEKELSSLSAILEKARDRYKECEANYKNACGRMVEGIPDSNALLERINATEKQTRDFDEKLGQLSDNTSNCKMALSAAAAAKETADSEKSNAEEKYAAAKKLCVERLAEKGLPSPEGFSPDREGIKSLSSLKNEYDAYISSLSSAEETFRRIEAGLSGKERPDMQKLEKDFKECETKCDELKGRITGISDNIGRLENLVRELTEKSEQLDKQWEVSLRQSEFAKLMSGSRGISFGRYYLQIMLGLVVDEANSMLSGVLGGKFGIEIKKDIAQNSKQGLDLVVVNSLSDSAAKYSAAGLSGGEKFLVSLVLGISLSAVVRSRFGGVNIDAMFIDEGFGSLDPAALKDAMDVIYGIRGSGRTVGIISHVEKLREDISCCVNVSKDKSGSRICVKM